MAEPTKNEEIEFNSAFDGPAPFCNKFFVHGGLAVVRLSFIEAAQMSESAAPIFKHRSAVTLSVQDARELVQGLKTVLENIDAASEIKATPTA